MIQLPAEVFRKSLVKVESACAVPEGWDSIYSQLMP
jgi:hypothetical protein